MNDKYWIEFGRIQLTIEYSWIDLPATIDKYLIKS